MPLTPKMATKCHIQYPWGAAGQGDGNISYELYESAIEPGTFITIEVWKSQEDLDGHMQTPHLQQALSEFGAHLAAPPAIHPLRPVG